MSIQKQLENGESLNLDQTDEYTAIIGSSPSKGARSPTLWNKVFRNQELSLKMHPMDVRRECLRPVIEELKKDGRFRGGAVAVPYKSEITKYLDLIEPSALVIGAVNCIYRDSAGKLVGANTDGEGAISSLQRAIKSRNFQNLDGLNVLVIGIGGAGHAVATSVASAIGPRGRLFLANRTAQVGRSLENSLKKFCVVKSICLPPSSEFIECVDIIINCSTVGYQFSVINGDNGFSLQPYTPLGKVNTVSCDYDNRNFEMRYMKKARREIEENISDSLTMLSNVRSHAIVFDIIYQPEQTMLLKLASCYGLLCMNGLDMNLDQAVLSFRRVMSEKIDKNIIREVMKSEAI